MMLLMFFPVWGIILFFVLPFWTALPVYGVLVGISGACQWLMMRSMRTPVQTGRKKMIGTTAVVINWMGRYGQVDWQGEIWQAETSNGAPLADGEKVVILGMTGLTLFVTRVGGH